MGQRVVSISVSYDDGSHAGTLELRALSESGSGLHPLEDMRGRADEHRELEDIRLLEGCEYRYALETHALRVYCAQGELLSPDDERGLSGRLRPGLRTGRLTLEFVFDHRNVRAVAFEVRSSKLGYLDDYRHMLFAIAELGSDAILNRFAASEQRLAPNTLATAATAYQRFALVKALVRSEAVEAAFARILRSPHVSWVSEHELVSPQRGARGSSSLARQLSRPGVRSPWPSAPPHLPGSVPGSVDLTRTEVCTDNPANQFVLFALEDWRAFAGKVRNQLLDESEALDRKGREPPNIARGLREASELESRLDEMVRHPLFADVGRLRRFPSSDQALLRKPGYRDIYRAYLLSLLGSSLSWSGGDDVFSAGQRDVATLYEYWVFIALGRILAEVCGTSFDMNSLLVETGHGLNLRLKRGNAASVRGQISVNGRDIEVTLHFNRTFTRNVSGGTWTRDMRPDCTLEFSPGVGHGAWREPVYLHFDAKYRIESLREAFGAKDAIQVSAAKPDDLVKMHAYRDSILRAVGAYVVYPGETHETNAKFSEILPGLGAFALRPGPAGTIIGESAVRRFMNDVIEHLGEQGSQHERARYWSSRIHAHEPARHTRSIHWLDKPPADARVLLGYVRSSEHLEWVRNNNLYNLRADNRLGSVGLRAPELSAEFVVLYGPALADKVEVARTVDPPRVMTREQLLAANYPRPGGDLYLCLPVEFIGDAPDWLERRLVEEVRTRVAPRAMIGAPVAATWEDLALGNGGPS